jgi:hypothetical protein
MTEITFDRFAMFVAISNGNLKSHKQLTVLPTEHRYHHTALRFMFFDPDRW